MSFIIEDGTGIADATSYVSVSYFMQYFSTMGDEALVDTDPEKIMSSLNRSAQYLDRTYRWRGVRTTRIQSMAFPRKDIITDYGTPFPPNQIPPCLLIAQCELAKRALTKELNPDITPSPFGDGVKKYNVGAATFYENVEYAAPGEVMAQSKYPMVDSLIDIWLYIPNRQSLNGVKIVKPFVSGATGEL